MWQAFFARFSVFDRKLYADRRNTKQKPRFWLFLWQLTENHTLFGIIDTDSRRDRFLYAV